MPAAVRAYVTAGVALVGASVISVTPVVPNLAAAQQEVRSVSMNVDLTAKSAANIPANFINMFLNMPQAHVDAVNYWADSWVQSGNWWVYSQDNILGWDRANPAMAWSMVDLLLPIPALSKPAGIHTQWWMAANLPMHDGCSGLPPCPNSTDMFNSMFKVPAWDFYFGDGYTFGEDGYTPEYEPVGPGESEWGYEYGEYGDKVPWWGQTVKLDPFDGWNSLMAYLQEDPQELKFPSFADTLAAYMKFTATLVTMFNPFVPQSYLWNPRYSAAAYLLRPFAKYLCPQCNKYDPFMPVSWKPGDPIPIPEDDGWQYGTPASGTPTGLPLPTEADVTEPGNGETALLVGGTWPTNILSDEEMKSVLGGYFADYSSRVNMVYPGSLNDAVFSVAIGAGILMNQITQTPGPKTVYGFSQGALVANLVMGLLVNKETAPAKEDLKFVLVADPSRGGNNAYQHILVPETIYDITVLTAEYDGVADFPDKWWNGLAVANALAGIATVHIPSTEIDIANLPDEYKKVSCNSKGGCTTSYFVPADELPLVKVLPFLKPYEAQLKQWIDAGYTRNDAVQQPSLLSLVPDAEEEEAIEALPTAESTAEEGGAADLDAASGAEGDQDSGTGFDLADVVQNLSNKFTQVSDGEVADETAAELVDGEADLAEGEESQSTPATPDADGDGAEKDLTDGDDSSTTVSEIQKRLDKETASENSKDEVKKDDVKKDDDKKDDDNNDKPADNDTSDTKSD